MGKNLKFIHLSDLHLLTRSQTIRGVDVRARLNAAVDCLCADFADADFCMVTGDLTDDGEIESFAEARRILDRLPFPWHATIGNHDTRMASAQDGLPDLPWHKDGALQYAFPTDAGQFIVLDSTVGGHVDSGVLDSGNLTFLRQQLNETRAAGRDVFVFMHHVPFDIGIGWLDRMKLQNPDDLWQVLKDFDHIRHMFFGHIHRPVHGSWHGIPCSSVRTTAHQVALRLGNDAPEFIMEDPSFAVVLVNEQQVIIHDHSFLNAAHKGPRI